MEPVQDLAMTEDGGEQHGVELIEVRDQLAVDMRERGAKADDAQRKALVQELVSHYEPVRNPLRDLGEHTREREPERDGEHERQRRATCSHRINSSRAVR